MEDIEAEGIGHEAEKQNHAYHLRVFDEFVAGLSTGDHLDEGKEGVTAVEGRDGQDIHKRQENAKDAGKHPEAFPVPDGGEDAGNTDDAAERILGLDLLGSEEELEVADIVGEGLDGLVNTGGYGLAERIRDVRIAEDTVRQLISEPCETILFGSTLQHGGDRIMSIADNSILDQHLLPYLLAEGGILQLIGRELDMMTIDVDNRIPLLKVLAGFVFCPWKDGIDYLGKPDLRKTAKPVLI